MAEPTPPAPPHRTTGAPDRKALVEAFQDVVRTEKEKQTGDLHAVTDRPYLYAVLMMILAVASATILVKQPAWLFSRPPEQPLELREASLRVRMFVEIDKIDRFKSAKGKLPETLTDAGVDTSGLGYVLTGSGYTLTGTDRRGLSLTYYSTTPPKEFLGKSYSLISARKRP
jgi:hypothetical protein